MADNSDDESLSSLLTAVNNLMKVDTKAMEETLHINRIIGNSKNPSECSAVVDFSMVSAAFQYYEYKKNEKNIPFKTYEYKKNEKNIPFKTSDLTNDIWDNSYAQIKEIDCTQPFDLNKSLDKSLCALQIDTDLISEWPRLSTDFLDLSYSFFDDIPNSSSIIKENVRNKDEFSNPSIIDFEINNSDLTEHSKGLDSNSSKSNKLLETPYESIETKSVDSKYCVSSSPNDSNTGEKNFVLRSFHEESYFPEELDYEPSDTGEEVKDSDSEFCIHNISKEERSGNFFDYCPQEPISENSTFQKENEEAMKSDEYAEICAGQDFISFFPSNFESMPGKSGLENDYNRSFAYDDDESESDQEHSFKRNSIGNRQIINQESLQQPLINSDISKVRHFNSIDEAIFYICQQCRSGNLNEAITIANKYIAISDEADQLEIFKELFMNAMNWIKSSVFPVEDSVISKSFGEIMKIFRHSKLFDSQLCSLIISECFGWDCTIQIGVKFFSFIQKIKVPVHSDAISSYIDAMMPEEIPSLEQILFMEYVKFVCYLPCPKSLLCKALGHFSKKEKSCLLAGFFRLCKFLCSVTSIEVEVNVLQDFIEFCIKNECWAQVASFCRAWRKEGHLISCLARSCLFRPEESGMFYEKLTEEIYRNEDVSLYLVGILGQLGVYLMLEVSSRKQYESAFQILFMLHKRNINYLELQACLYNAPSYLKSLPEFTDIFVFPFTVAFAALDICLHLKRFRDAYRIFKSFSLNLPVDMGEKIKLKVRLRRFGYLLKLTQELYLIEPLKLGLQAFHDICSAAKDFSLEEWKDFTEEIQVIYNKYLAYVINGCQLHTALELFEYSEGPLKEFFIVSPQVLRSLLVTFAQNDKMDEAYKFFALGCKRKIYDLDEQAKTTRHGWCLIIMSSWTTFELEFLIKTFLKNISLALNHEHQADFEKLLSVQILFEESKEDCLEIDCLKKSRSLDSAKEITCNVLKSLDANIKWVENQNPVSLELVPEKLINYWIKTSPNFLWMKNSREKLLEDARGKAGFKIQVSEEDFNSKYFTKPLNKVLGQLTPEYSVADSSHQLISDKTYESSETLPETKHRETPEITTSKNNHLQISDLNVLRSTEQEQIISSSNQLPSNEYNQLYPEFFNQLSPDASNQLSPDASNQLSPGVFDQLPLVVSNQLSQDVPCQLSPDVSIQLSPYISSQLSPEVSNQLSPEVSNQLSPEVSKQLSPEVSKQLYPDVSKQLSPDVSSQLSPDVSIQLSPDVSIQLSPDVSSRLSPDVSSRLSPDVSKSNSELPPVVSKSLEINSKLSPGVSKSLEINSKLSPDVSNQLYSDAHSFKTVHLDGKLSKIDVLEHISTRSGATNQENFEKELGKSCSKMKVFESPNQCTPKNSVSMAVKQRKKIKRVQLNNVKKNSNAPGSKKVEILPPETEKPFLEQDLFKYSLPLNSNAPGSKKVEILPPETEKPYLEQDLSKYSLPLNSNAPGSKKVEILPPETEKPSPKQPLFKTKKPFQRRPSKAWRVTNFQVTLKNAAEGKGSRSVIPGSQLKLAEPTNNSNVPEAVFQKIILFLQSKVLLKCRDLPPQQQVEKVNHLAALFIQSNDINGLDKKTMKLLSEFAESSI